MPKFGTRPFKINPLGIALNEQYPILKLIFNHIDAWTVAFATAGLAIWLHQAFEPRTLVLLAAVTTGYWFAFAINDYFDAAADAVEPEKARRNYFVSNWVDPQKATPASSLIIGLLCAAFLPFGWRGLLVTAVCFFVTWGYSAPPLHFKSRPGLDLLIHAFFVQTFPYIISLFLTQVRWTTLDFMIIAITFCASFSGQLEQQIRDYRVDLLAGVRNFTSVYGVSTAVIGMKVATILMGMLSLIGIITQIIPLYLLPIALIALPAMLHRFTRLPHQPRSEKLAHLLVVIGLIYLSLIFIYQAS